MKSFMTRSSMLCNLILAIYISSVTPFTTTTTNVSRNASFMKRQPRKPTLSRQKMMSLDDSMIVSTVTESTNAFMTSFQSTSTFISTISADIDNISNDEFGKVFAGGIFVMIGGVVSALIVGFLLESNNSYANVVADSYAQSGDEEFWEKLSPEDQVKAKELIAKIKASKEGNSSPSSDTTSQEVVVPSMINGEATGKEEPTPSMTPVVNEENKKKDQEAVSMFSDYDD